MGTCTFDLYEQLPFIYRLKLYALFINGENEAVLSDLLYRGALKGRFDLLDIMIMTMF